MHKQVEEKEQLFLEYLRHKKIRAVRSAGMLIAVEFDSFETNKKVIEACLNPQNELSAVLVDWFLFSPECLRIAPPLTISKKLIRRAGETIQAALATL